MHSCTARRGSVQIQIETFSGTILDGIVLKTFRTTMRVAIPGCDDAVEFFFHGGVWFWEGREPVGVHVYGTSAYHDADWFASVRRTASMGCDNHQAAWVN